MRTKDKLKFKNWITFIKNNHSNQTIKTNILLSWHAWIVYSCEFARSVVYIIIIKLFLYYFFKLVEQYGLNKLFLIGFTV